VSSADKTPSVSVVICTRNRPFELERCLRGVRAQSYGNFDVLVVDNGPCDATACDIARRWDASYAPEPEEGLSRARNLGMRISTGEIIAFLDDDAVPQPEWLCGLAAEFQDPQVAVVAGRIQELRIDRKSSSGASSGLFSLDSLGDRRRVIDRSNPQWFEIANFGGIGQGSNMALRRSALQCWPGFDPRLGRGSRISGSEEHYAFFRLVEHGARAVYTPDALVWHPYPADPEALRAHELRHLAASTGYLTFLFFEAPGQRRRLVRYVAEALRGVRRNWRAANPPRSAHVHARWRRALALLRGPALYLLVRLDQKRRFPGGGWFGSLPATPVLRGAESRKIAAISSRALQ
jgi:cellulose synthase/poly-beta-1,6-N-acetylglucosamine synthase-like glycosyltransferase